MSSQTYLSIDNQSALMSYGAYPFNTDETYQQGLASILAGGTVDTTAPPEVQEEMIRRTRVFYFNQVTGNSITLDEAREYERSLQEELPQLATTSSEADDETRVLTFAELKELIESGKVDKIPNNKIIPEKLNEAPPSSSHAPSRKKPWELTVEAP